MQLRPVPLRASLAAVAIVAATPAAARPGRAVRVPRTTAAVTTSARFCSLQEDDRGLCFAPVVVGDTGTVLTGDGENLGQTDIVEVTANPNRCGAVENWSIRIDRARLGGRYIEYGGVLAVGVAMTGAGRILPASGPPPDDNPLASTMYVLDTDGDRRADLQSDQYPCDADRRPTRSSYPTHMCTEYWVAVRERWVRARVDQAPICNR